MPGTGLATAARPTGNSAKRRIGENIEVKVSRNPRALTNGWKPAQTTTRRHPQLPGCSEGSSDRLRLQEGKARLRPGKRIGRAGQRWPVALNAARQEPIMLSSRGI
jgi:hypothetical protein